MSAPLPLPERGRLGNIVVSARAALRAQHLVILVEERGLDKERARLRLGIPERTANRYLATWGTR